MNYQMNLTSTSQYHKAACFDLIPFNLYISTLSYEIGDLPLILSGYADDLGAHNSFDVNSGEDRGI